MNKEKLPITVIYGDGVGPEIMEATLNILRYAKAPIHIETASIGKINYEHGIATGISPDAWEPIKRNKIILKAPTITKSEHGQKNSSTALKKILGLHFSVEEYFSIPELTNESSKKQSTVNEFHTRLISENEEGFHTGIEHQIDDENYQLSYIITEKQIDRMLSYSKKLATELKIKEISAIACDDISELVESNLSRIYDEWRNDNKNILLSDNYISEVFIDILQAPENYPLIVMSNYNSLILRNIFLQKISSNWIPSSYSIGSEYALFEPIHGCYENLEGKDFANPSGMLNAAINMLCYLGYNEIASNIKNAWLSTIEDGIHTSDIYQEGISKKNVGTNDFAKEIANRIGDKPKKISPVKLNNIPSFEDKEDNNLRSLKQMVGVDIFFMWQEEFICLQDLCNFIQEITKKTSLKLQMLGSKGIKLWPQTEITEMLIQNISKGDLIRARFVAQGIGEKKASSHEVVELLDVFSKNNISFIKTDNLYVYGDRLGFSLAYGE